MKLCFLPGQLFLEKREDGIYELRHEGTILGQFKSERQAVTAFNELRRKLESEFPMKEASPEEKKRLLIEELARSAVPHNSPRNYGPRKSTGTRTFG